MTYALNSKIVTIEEFENVEVFGITIFNNDSMIMKVEDILDKFIRYGVSVYHVIDVIEDEILEHVG